MKIDNCICYDRSFRRIYKEATENGIDNVHDLKKVMNICNKCERCNPYLEEMFKNNIFTFEDIID